MRRLGYAPAEVDKIIAHVEKFDTIEDVEESGQTVPSGLKPEHLQAAMQYAADDPLAASSLRLDQRPAAQNQILVTWTTSTDPAARTGAETSAEASSPLPSTEDVTAEPPASASVAVRCQETLHTAARTPISGERLLVTMSQRPLGFCS